MLSIRDAPAPAIKVFGFLANLSCAAEASAAQAAFWGSGGVGAGVSLAGQKTGVQIVDLFGAIPSIEKGPSKRQT